MADGDAAVEEMKLLLILALIFAFALAAQTPEPPKATPETVAASQLKELTADRDNQQAWAEMQNLLLQIPQYIKALDKWNGTLAAWRAAVAERQAAEKALEQAKLEAAKESNKKDTNK